MSNAESAGHPKPVWDIKQFERFVPPGGFIRDYLHYAIQCTDAPPLYHILTGTALVSAAVSPHLDLSFHDEIHPLHLYILLIGDSSESRKTSAMKRGTRLADPVMRPLSMLGDRIWFPVVSSPEGITEELGKEPNRLMVYNEWTEMHRSTGKAGYWQHSSEYYNLLYDAQDVHRSRSKSKTLIQRPRVTILAASTPSLVNEATTRGDWLAGKLARYIIGCMTRPPEREMSAAIDLPNEVLLLRGRYTQLAAGRPPGTGTGNARMSEEAWQFIQDWQKSAWWVDLKNRAPEHLKPSFARAQEHVFRLAAVYEASMSYPFDVLISAQTAQAAVALIEWCYESMVKTFPTVRGDENTPLARVTATLAAIGTTGVSRKVLMRITRLTSRQFHEAIGTLVERGDLQATGRGNDTWYIYTPGKHYDE